MTSLVAAAPRAPAVPRFRVRLIVLGAVDRGDDALGPLAVAKLRPEIWPLVDVRVCSSLDVVDLADVPAGGACLVVDAARGLPAGAIRFIPFRQFLSRRAPRLPSPRSSHELPVPELVRLVNVVRGGLPDGGFLIAGGESFGLGELPSREVALAVPELAAAVASAVERYAARQHRLARAIAKAARCASR